MKKVGIITFHSSINYGVYLQAYALQTAIQKMGYSSEILDYNKMVESSDSGSRKTIVYRIVHIKDTLRAVKLKAFRATEISKLREKKFAEFGRIHFVLSKPMNHFSDLKQVNPDYDYFVCGSDQIWNPHYTKGNPVYFLAFAEQSKRIMYAPSYGVSNIELFKPYRDLYEKRIKELHGLSVRESSGVEITEKLSGITPIVVVDPTLLISEKDWSSLEKAPQNVPDRFVLFYVLGNDKRYEALARKIHSVYQIKVITIPISPIWGNDSSYCLMYAGIEEFIYLVHHAEHVITDSFHGVVFSTIYKKNFTAIKREDTKYSLISRIEDYLNKIGLIRCCKSIVSCMDQVDEIMSKAVDYRSCNEQLPKWVEESREFLSGALR